MKQKYRKSITGQKILVGNVNEMILRTLRDIYEGVDVVVQKPMENVFVLGVIKLLCEGSMSIDKLISGSEISNIIEKSPSLFSDNFLFSKKLADNISRCKIGAYEISGTYQIYKLIEDAHGADLAFGMLDEQFKNVISITGNKLDSIISRNSKWYIKNRESRSL